jgi:hypothetical protein
MALKAFQHGRQTTGILGTNPVQFEPVGNKQSEALLVFGDLRGQGFDPGVELLFWQFLGQLLHAAQPEVGHLVGVVTGVKSLVHGLGSSKIRDSRQAKHLWTDWFLSTLHSSLLRKLSTSLTAGLVLVQKRAKGVMNLGPGPPSSNVLKGVFRASECFFGAVGGPKEALFVSDLRLLAGALAYFYCQS